MVTAQSCLEIRVTEQMAAYDPDMGPVDIEPLRAELSAQTRPSALLAGGGYRLRQPGGDELGV